MSSRNRLHLLGDANDYRTVDLPAVAGLSRDGREPYRYQATPLPSSLAFQAAGGTLPTGAVAQLIVARPYKTPVASASRSTAGCDLREEVHFSVVLNLPNVPVPTDPTDLQIMPDRLRQSSWIAA